jgi:hypothetical protein
MTRRILVALITISFVLLTAAPPDLAQERQLGDRTPTGGRPQGDRQILTPEDAEKMRGDLVTAYDETKALINYLAGFEFLRQSQAMEDYETVAEDLVKERTRVAQLSILDVMLEVNTWPNADSVSRIIEASRSVRTDPKFQEAILMAERFYQAGSQARSSSAKKANSRGVIAAPAFIAPICDHNDPSNYPSGTDIAIASAVGLALHTLADVLPDLLGFLFSVPDFVKIALVIAAGVADEVRNALEAVAADAKYCEGIRLYIEDKLANESGLTAILLTDDYYLSFTVKTVKASITKATADGIPTNCAGTRLAEAQAFFDASDLFNGSNGADRVTAFKKLRAAFRNIGAPTCVQ